MTEEHYIETAALREFLATWRNVRELIEAQQYEGLVREYGADFVAHLDIGELPRTIADLETQIAQRG
jgi:hypothetical protein